jgi:tetratricopeptide (TPR) repeat protein
MGFDDRLFEVKKLHAARSYREIDAKLSVLPRQELVQNAELAMLLASAWMFLYRHKEAGELLLDTRASCLGANDEGLRSYWEFYLGVSFLFQGRLLAANRLFQQSMATAQYRDDRRLIYWLNSSLGVAASVRGDMNDAVKYYSRVITGAQQHGSRYMVAATHHNLGVVLRDWGRFVDAAAHFLLAEEYFEPEGKVEEHVFTRAERAVVILRLGDQIMAERLARRAVETLANLEKNWYLEAAAYKALGIVLTNTAALDEASASLELALAAAQNLGNIVLVAGVYEETAILSLVSGRFSAADAHLKKAENLYYGVGAVQHCERLRNRFAALRNST